MSSLKRILNQDAGSGLLHPDEAGHRPWQDANEPSETLALVDWSWPEIWEDVLHPDGDHNEQGLALSDAEAIGHSILSVEESIETWTAQNIPSSSGPSAQPHATPTTTLEASDVAETSERICYGMLYRVAVRLIGDMLELDSKLKAANGFRASERQSFEIQKSSDQQLFLNFRDGTRFASINDQITKALGQIIDRPFVDFDAVTQTEPLRKSISRAQKASNAIVRVNINIYGPRLASKEIGEDLSSHKAYLQRPDNYRRRLAYDNPQVLKFPGMQVQTLEQQPMEITKGSASSSVTPEQFRKAISDLYGTLKRGTKLVRLVGGKRLKTQLLPHQQEALDFMIQREHGTSPMEFRLWKPVESEGKTWYEHAVTKARSRIQHEEKGGGILADEMGMGKSLSILALIVETIEKGRSWVEEQKNSEADDATTTPSRATLVIVSSALLVNNWLNEIEVHLDGTLKTIKHHGQGRETHVSIISDADIVVTTYNTLVVEFGKKSSPLHRIAWYRVVLDEGHIIRRQATIFNRTVSELKANSRWCLTGTPIQNRLEDIGTLFAFIRARPFDNMAIFRRYIATPFVESEDQREIASQRLTLLIDSLCLRRTKDLLRLESQQDYTHELEFSLAERDQYEQTKKVMIRAIRQRVGDFDRKNMFGMFQAQLQLRILCNHGTYQHHFTWARSKNLLDEREDAMNNVGSSWDIKCSRCRQSMPILGSNAVLRKYAENCAHVLCSECLDETEEGSSDDRIDTKNRILHCPLCISSGTVIPNAASYATARRIAERDDEYFRPQGHSSKMTALIKDVKADLWVTKSVIFSCWTRTLNLVAKHLAEENIPFERIDGECVLTRRQNVLDEFAQSPKTPVLIMTTGTGAFGLNLTSANRVFIVEPQWNPSVENQAIARAIRLGQTRQVHVTRYVVKGTVEQEMRSQQERKLRLAQIGFE